MYKRQALANETYENTTVDELADEIKSGAVRLIDVRRQTEWDAGRIKGAEHMFLGRLLDSYQDLKEDAVNRPVVLQCRTGSRSSIASSLLQAAGIKNVINLKGGVEEWQAKGHPVETENESGILPACELGSASDCQTVS